VTSLTFALSSHTRRSMAATNRGKKEGRAIGVMGTALSLVLKLTRRVTLCWLPMTAVNWGLSSPGLNYCMSLPFYLRATPQDIRYVNPLLSPCLETVFML
jgi:hypothetical protein